jgi:hypothetical protein
MRNGLLVAVVVIVLSSAAAALRAAPVPVGGSASFPFNGGGGFVPPAGDLVDSETRTLDLTYTAPAGMTFDPAEVTTTTATLTQEVRRDTATGQLSFIYKIDQPDNVRTGAEGAMATYISFGAFSTDVVGDPKSGTLTVSRSADGASLLANGDSMGLGRPPTFAVTTDATNFDKNGSLTLELTDEFAFVDQIPAISSATAMATFDSIFEPAAEGPPPPPPPTGIPLPASFWSGLVLLGSCAAFAKLRQLHATT